MAKILPFKQPRASERHKGKALCRSGHHRWEVECETVFDVKQGRLVSRYRCERCGAIRTQAR